MKRRIIYKSSIPILLFLVLVGCWTSEQSNEALIFSVPIKHLNTFGDIEYSYNYYMLDGNLSTNYLGRVDQYSRVYKDRLYFVEKSGSGKGEWKICVSDLDGGGVETVYQEESEKDFPGAELYFYNDYIYVPIHRRSSEGNNVRQTLLFCVKTDGTDSRYISEIDMLLLLYAVDEEYIYYCDKATQHPIKYSLESGESVVMADVQVYHRMFKLDNDVIWFFESIGEPHDRTIYLCRIEDGKLYRNETDSYIRDDYNFVFNNGWIYYYDDYTFNAETKELKANLYRTRNIEKDGRFIVSVSHYSSNFPPEITFGEQGFVIANSYFGEDEIIRHYRYVTYDGKVTELFQHD